MLVMHNQSTGLLLRPAAPKPVLEALQVSKTGFFTSLQLSGGALQGVCLIS